MTGGHYSFKIAAANLIGEGEMSNSFTIAMAMRANQPTKPTVSRELSTLTSLYVHWTESLTPGDIKIEGYLVYLIEMATGQVT